MRICYFYCRDSRLGDESFSAREFVPEALDSVQMNFDSEWRFEFDGNSRCKVMAGQRLPPHFFSYDKHDHVFISAIVGANGCGKTSFARMMHLMSLDTGKINVFVVGEVNGRMHVWGDFKGVRFVPASGMPEEAKMVEQLNAAVAVSVRYRNIRKAFRFVYYSPVYSSQHVMDRARNDAFNSKESFFLDLSTTGLLRHPDQIYDRQNFYRNFEYLDARRTWRFYAKYDNLRRQGSEDPGSCLLSLPSIKGAKLIFNLRLIKEAEEAYRQAAQIGGRRTGAFVGDVNALIDFFSHGMDFCTYAIYAACITRWYALHVGLADGANARNQDVLRLQLLQKIVEKEKACAARQSANYCKLIIAYFKNIRIEDGSLENNGSLLYLYKALLGLRSSRKSVFSDGLNTVLSSQKRVDDFLTAYDEHFRLCVNEDFLLFEPRPRFSTGEWALLTMMGRIYDLCKTQCFSDLILFLDEAETTLHPNWQKRLVKDMIRFFENCLPGVRAHVIFATHSPLLLSDMPKGNVVFLKNCDDKCQAVDIELSNTFAANIYDLFKSSFFLKGGAIGEHASHHIGALLGQIAETIRNNRSCDFSKWLEIVGDPAVRKYIEGLRDMGVLQK